MKNEYIFADYKREFAECPTRAGEIVDFGGAESDLWRIVKVGKPERNENPVIDTVALCGHIAKWRLPIVVER